MLNAMIAIEKDDERLERKPGLKLILKKLQTAYYVRIFSVYGVIDEEKQNIKCHRERKFLNS
jgi:hypothetical protein